MRYHLDRRQLRVVAAIARLGSISAAAQQLGLAQSTLTKQLLRIEAELGVPLFERRPRGVSPTLYGRALLRHGSLVERQFKEIQNEIAALAGGEAGRVGVGTGPTWAHGPLPLAVANLVRKRPRLRVEVLTDPTERLLRELRAARLDLVLMPWVEDVDRDGLDWTPVLIDDLRVMARRGHPLVTRPPRSLRDLRPFGWVLGTKANPARRRLELSFQNEGLGPPEPVVETTSGNLTIDIVRQSDLLTVLPEVRFEWASWGLASIEGPGLAWRRSSGIFRRRGAVPTPAAQALVDELLAVCRAYYEEVEPEAAGAAEDGKG